MINGKTKKRRCKTRRRLKRREYKKRKEKREERSDDIFNRFKNNSNKKG